MNSDRELLELSVKAAGYGYVAYGGDIWLAEDGVSIKHWNPLKDDGDALRLAVHLNITVSRFDNLTNACPLLYNCGCDERDDGDAYAATRRAIVRAAAHIGRI